MTNKELIAYTNTKRMNGESDSAIARSLGMSLTHFIGLLNQAEKELGHDIYKEYNKPSNKPKTPKNTERPVSGFGDSEAVKAAFQRAEEKRTKNNKVKKPKEEIKEEPTETVEVKKESKPEEEFNWMDD